MICRAFIWFSLALGLTGVVCLTQAQERGQLTLSPPTWILPGASVDCDFANQRYWNCALDQNFSITRASSGYAQDDSLIWRLFASNTLRIGGGNGLLIEEARTNDALWSRDMTNAAWVKVGMGTALNAVGIDGTANSATTLTATGTASSCTASCTALQTITLGSTADTYSVWLMRVSGSGAVNITINNLVGTTACTLVTASFTRCSVTATLANPVFGIQMTTVGDVIVADVNQLEPGGFATSPIVTTSATATRAKDIVAFAGSMATILSGNNWSFVLATKNLVTASNQGRIFNLNGGSHNIFTSTDTVADAVFGGTQLTATLGSGTYSGSTVKTGYAQSATNRWLAANNGTVTTDAHSFGSGATYDLMSNNDSIPFPDGYGLRFSLFGFTLPSATLGAMTQ